MAKRTSLSVAVSLGATALVMAAVISITCSQRIAQAAFRQRCVAQHDDYNSYKVAYDKVNSWGHYYDFVIPSAYPDRMGFCRVYVSWIGTTDIRYFQGRAF